MTIEKGRPWGTIGPRPDGVVEVGSDAELRALVEGCRARGEPLPVVALPAPGDLLRTVDQKFCEATKEIQIIQQVNYLRVFQKAEKRKRKIKEK